MISNVQHYNMLTSPARSIVGKVELYKGSTLSQTFLHTNALSSFTVSRAGSPKFFGFGVCQELEMKLIDQARAINVIENDILKVSFDVEGDTVYPTPQFYVSSEIVRNENNNELLIKAYDATYKAKNHAISELGLTPPYTIATVATRIASFLGLAGVSQLNVLDTSFSTSYGEGANWNGTETLRDVLDDIAEATQTIYYISPNNKLIFKRLNINGYSVLTIKKSEYFTLDSKTNRTLANICSATELGDNVITTSGQAGATQYVRDNAFWELRDDIVTLLDNALRAAGGLTINQFYCQWRGNYLLEPGDKINIITKNNDMVSSYLLNDKYIYDGGLSAETSWDYADNEDESADNPITLGDNLKKTSAKVDKVNQTIDLTISQVEGQNSRLTALELNTDSITASVQQIQTTTDERFNSVGEELETLTNRVEATMTPEAVEIKIQEAMGEGAKKVVTETGFKFDEDGLTVSKSGSEMTTNIDEDGMSVYKDGNEVLTVDNTGVKALDLRAVTYLHIGTYSRFQDYDGGRTGCFWIL